MGVVKVAELGPVVDEIGHGHGWHVARSICVHELLLLHSLLTVHLRHLCMLYGAGYAGHYAHATAPNQTHRPKEATAGDGRDYCLCPCLPCQGSVLFRLCASALAHAADLYLLHRIPPTQFRSHFASLQSLAPSPGQGPRPVQCICVYLRKRLA